MRSGLEGGIRDAMVGMVARTLGQLDISLEPLGVIQITLSDK